MGHDGAVERDERQGRDNPAVGAGGGPDLPGRGRLRRRQEDDGSGEA